MSKPRKRPCFFDNETATDEFTQRFGIHIAMCTCSDDVMTCTRCLCIASSSPAPKLELELHFLGEPADCVRPFLRRGPRDLDGVLHQQGWGNVGLVAGRFLQWPFSLATEGPLKVPSRPALLAYKVTLPPIEAPRC